MATPCEKKPWICQPRKIELVAFDCDDTILRIHPYGIASNIRGPLTKIDEDTLETTEEPLPPIYYPVEPEPTPPRPPLTQVYNPETGKWEWVHKIKPSMKLHPLRFIPSYEEERVVIEEWGKTPEEELEVKEIAKELIESLPEKDRRLLEITTEVTGEQIELIPVPPAKKERWWKMPPPKPPKKVEPAYKPRKIRIKLEPGFRDTLDKLDEKGILKTIISLNTPGSVKRILEAFGLSDRFVEIADSWDEKGKVFAKQTETYKVNPCNALFVDNMQGHVESVIRGGALGLVYDKDIKEISELLHFIEG